jgi:hypothetical protein
MCGPLFPPSPSLGSLSLSLRHTNSLLTDGFSAGLLLSLLGGRNRHHLLEEFCFWYPWKFIVTSLLLGNMLIETLATKQLKFHG